MATSTDQRIDAIQTAILWSGSALIIGALMGFGLGVTITRDYYQRRRNRS